MDLRRARLRLLCLPRNQGMYPHLSPHEAVADYIFQGPTLEEISRIFDGDDAVPHVDMHAIEKGVHSEHLDNLGSEKTPHVEQVRV